ncbi:protein SCAR2-like isoform X2 [Apium graveolens]|uniref:protein SCAR2-like isoform X2 n=1 Tax=Apium graveolens TaxID=4045 RepID=UPI003D79EF07
MREREREMPMSRYEIRNEYSLADPEIYGGGAANRDDDPEALLEAVAMAGLVGVLRQLGDLAQFAADLFHDLHEEVMITATRGHGLMVRVKQLEADFPVIEKAFLSQRSPSAFYSNPGAGWHPSLRTNQNLITGGDLPRFIMDSYEECRGPPRLFLLDKFDVAGAGACLKRYTNPSFFKVGASIYVRSSAEVQKEKRSRKSKKKGSRLRNAGNPEVLPASHAKLQQLFLEDRVENGVTDSARLVKLKRLNRHPFGSETGKSFMEKFISVSSPEDKVVHEVTYGSLAPELSTASASGTGVSYLKESTSVERTVLTPFVDEVSEHLRRRELSLVTKHYPLEVVEEKEIAVNGERKPDASEDDNQSDDVASEVDTYMDALATMEPEIETDTDVRSRYDNGFVDMENQATDCDVNEELLQVQSSDSPSTGNSNGSEDGNDSVKKGSSSFSYSDTESTAAENVPVDVFDAAKVSPSTKFCEDEVTVILMKKHSPSVELLEAQDYQLPKLDVSDDISNEVTNLPSYGSYSGDHCSSVLIPDSVLTRIPLDDGIARGTSAGAQTVRISSNHDELDTKSIQIKENSRSRGNNIPWTSRHSNVPSKTKVDEPTTRTASSENHTVEILDGDLSVLPSASIHISENIREVIPKKHDNECSLYNSFEVEYEGDIFTEDLIEKQISPRHSVISHADIKPSVPAFLDSETSNTVLQPEVLDPVDNVSSSTKSITVNSNIASNNCHMSSVAEQQEAEWTEDVPEISIVAASDSSYEEETPTSILPEAYSGETDEIASSISLVGSEATAVMIESDHLYSGGFRSCTGFPLPSKVADGGLVEVPSGVNLDDTEAAALAIFLGPLNITGPESLTDEKQTEVCQLENIIATAIVANHDSEADKVNSISKQPLQAEDNHCVQFPDQYGSEVYDKILPLNYNESVKQTAEVHQETAPPDLNSVWSESEIDIGDHSNTEMVSYVPVSRSQTVETTVLSSSSIYCVQSSQPVSSGENNLHEHSGDTSPVSTHHFPEVSTLSKPELNLQTSQFNIEPQHVVASKPKEVSQSEQLSCSNYPGEGSSDTYSEPCFVASKSVPVNLQADGLAVKSLYGDKENFVVSSKLAINHVDHGGNFITSPRPLSMTPTSELSQPGGHEVDISEQPRDELSAISLGFLSIPELPQVRLPEMPPLPPLPPVQWRTGRVQQHSSLPSDRDSVQNNFGLFQPMFPSKASNNTQMGNLMNRNDFLAPVPVVPLLDIKDKDHQHAYEHLLGTTSPLSIQMPLTSNNRSRDVPTSGSISNTDPCLTMLSTDNESPCHHMHAGEPGSMLSSVTPSSTVTGADASNFSGSVPGHPSSQMQQEICQEPELIKFSDTNFPQPTVADEHLKDVCTTLECETVTSTSNSLYPATEAGIQNGNWPMKLPRPRSPLIDAVAAHDKSMLRKVTERSRPEVQKVEERDSLLEQIRAKSFNLKPAVLTRPSIQGPKANLRVAAILEKANTIRQAFAGSDEDEDSWSDS